MKTQAPNKISRFIRSYSIVSFLLLSTFGNTQIISLSSGNWNTAATWSPSGVPSGSDVVVINGAIVLNKSLTGGSGISGSLTINTGRSLVNASNKDLTVKSGGLLVVYGTLDVENLDFLGGSNVYVATGGEIIVRKNFSNFNNSDNITVDGTLTIYGNAHNGSGGIISGAGTIKALGGNFSGTGTIGPIIVLPIQLLAFSAQEENSKVVIRWTTGTELNNDYFTIEKSEDGIHFRSIGFVKGAGNSVVVNEYHFEDAHSSFITYYRLKQTDYNGSASYNGGLVVVAPEENSMEVQVYPNPVQDSNIYVKLGNASIENISEIIVSDISGKEVYKSASSESNALITIPKVVLLQGLYVLTIKSGSDIVSKKVFVI